MLKERRLHQQSQLHHNEVNDMQEMYATLLLHAKKQAINEDNLGKVLQAAGATVDATRLKALAATLEGVNIDDAIAKSAMVSAAPTGGQAEKKEEKKEEDTAKKAEEAAAGLGALFG